MSAAAWRGLTFLPRPAVRRATTCPLPSPDCMMTAGDSDLEASSDPPIGRAPARRLRRETARVAQAAANQPHRHPAILDLDYRQPFWANANAYRDAVQAVLPRTDIVV